MIPEATMTEERRVLGFAILDDSRTVSSIRGLYYTLVGDKKPAAS
jgi:hypothetical protein